MMPLGLLATIQDFQRRDCKTWDAIKTAKFVQTHLGFVQRTTIIVIDLVTWTLNAQTDVKTASTTVHIQLLAEVLTNNLFRQQKHQHQTGVKYRVVVSLILL